MKKKIKYIYIYKTRKARKKTKGAAIKKYVSRNETKNRSNNMKRKNGGENKKKPK